LSRLALRAGMADVLARRSAVWYIFDGAFDAFPLGSALRLRCGRSPAVGGL